MATMMPKEYYRVVNNSFLITDQTQNIQIGAMRVSGLNRSADEYTYREGHEVAYVHKFPGLAKTDDVTIERAVFRDEIQSAATAEGNYFDTWFSLVENNEGVETNTGHRREIIVEVFDREGNTVRSYVLENCWPKSITYTDLDAVGGNEVVKETVVLSVERVQSVVGYPA